MSDRGDYKEPKAGDWMVIVHPQEGDVDCKKVESVHEGIARLTDNSAWGAETGQPLHARWRGHFLWQADPVFLPSDIGDLFSDASPEALAEVYAVLLTVKRAREKAKDDVRTDDAQARIAAMVALFSDLTDRGRAEAIERLRERWCLACGGEQHTSGLRCQCENDE